MIDPQTVQKILDTADIVDVVSDFVSLRRRGANYIGLCPFHDEKTGSFTVSPSKGICKCFGCGKGGSPVNFIMQHEQLDYPGALRYLAKKYNIPIEERELTESEKASKTERDSMFAVNEWAANYFSHVLKNTDEGKNIGLSYFRERGISEQSIEKFGLGYSLDSFSAMTQAAKAKGYKEQFLVSTGLSGKSQKGELYDRFKGRVIFPVHTLSGKIVAFGGRILATNDKTAKYVNSPESTIYHKSNELYGIYQAKQGITKLDKCYLVEGYTDVISMHQSGITNVVASSGTALTHGQIRMIHRLTKNITVLYDGDSAGIKAALKGTDLLLAQGLNVKVVILPDGEDPDSYARKNNSSDFIHFIDENEVDFIHFKINLLMNDAKNDPIKRAKLIKEIAQSIACIPDQIYRSVYIKEASRLLDTPENVINSEINKIRAKAKEEEAKQKLRELNKGKYQPQPTHSTSHQPTVPPPPEGPTEVPPPPPEFIPPYSEAPDISDVPPHGYEYEPQDTSDVPPPPPPDEIGNYQPSDTPKRITHNEHSKYYQNELEICYFLLRNGADEISFNEDHSSTIGEYIIEELQNFKCEGREFLYSTLLNRFVQLYSENTQKEGFNPFRFFVNYPDPQISELAADLLSDKHELSKMYDSVFIGDITNEKDIENHKQRMQEKHISEVYHATSTSVMTYIFKILTDKKLSINQEIKNLERSNNNELVFNKLRELTDLNKTLLEIGKIIGKRVIS